MTSSAESLTVERKRLYLSQVLDKSIIDGDGERVARVRDLVVRFGSDPHPPISGLLARQGRRTFFLEWSQVAELSHTGVRLATFTVNLQPFERRDSEALLRRDILDKQVIDIDGRRVVRVSDLELALVDGDYRLVGVDVSAQGMLRRLGPAAFSGRFESRHLIDWEDIESFAIDVPMVRLRVPHAGVAALHPVEIARIIESLPYRHGHEVLDALAPGVAADAVQELPPDDAANHLAGFDRARAADILDEMDPDEAADILADLPEEHAEALLALMEPDESADVRELLAYAEDSAAGLMTTDYLALPRSLTVGEGLARLRALDDPPRPLYHIYLVEAEGSNQLVGAVPLLDLVLVDPATPLVELSRFEVKSVHPDDSPREVAHTMGAYNLPDLPVLDERGNLLGIVLVDDALDAMYPDLWRHRMSERPHG